jgi:hypothetical protein
MSAILVRFLGYVVSRGQDEGARSTMSSATRLNPKNMRPEPSRASAACPPSPSNVAAIGRPPSGADGALGATAGLADVAGDEAMPGRAGVTTEAEGEVKGASVGVVGTVKFEPGAAVTDTREAPNAMTKMFSLGLLGGFHWM